MALVASYPTKPLVTTTTEGVATNSNDEEVNVFFHLVNGMTLCLVVNLFFEDIATIKKRLVAAQREQKSFRSQDLFFICNGKPLDDDGYLYEYNIQENATIHVSARNRGGCFMVSFSILMVIFMALIGSTCTCGLSLVVVPFLVPLLFVLPLFCL